jgi:hypothetical protein
MKIVQNFRKQAQLFEKKIFLNIKNNTFLSDRTFNFSSIIIEISKIHDEIT